MTATMAEKHPPTPELSRPIPVDSLGEGRETVFEIHAGAEERAALAGRFGLSALDHLSATVAATRAESGVVRLTGRLKAEVVQTCVVTLEPVPATIDAEFARAYSPTATLEDREEVSLAPDDNDPPEPLQGGTVDAGEVVAETLSLALDPFPRAPGAALPPLAEDPDESGNIHDKSGPFAALAKLKKRR